MFKKFWKQFKDYLRPLESGEFKPKLETTRWEREMKKFSYMPLNLLPDSEESVYRRNAQRIELARFQQEKDAIDKNLKAQHRLMIAALMAVIVAIISSLVAVVIALTAKPPVVNVQNPSSSQKH